MLFKNVASQKAIVFAYDKTTGAAKTGDAANITASVSKDGGSPAVSNDTNPTEIGGGWYAFDLTQAETNCDVFLLYAASATSNILVSSVAGYTTGGSIPQAGVLAAASYSAPPSAASIRTEIDTNSTKLDATMSSRLASASYSAPDSAATIAAAVWAAATRTLSAISDSSGVTSLLNRLTADRATALDHLDVSVASRLASASYSAPPSAQDNADALLKRDWTAVSGEASRSVLNALRFLRNKWSLSGTTVTVTKENDSTTAWTATVTTNASADPVTGSDPS